MIINKKFFCGFSLAEALVVLLVLAIIAAITVPMITKKRNTLKENAVHGKWSCKYIDGVLKSATAPNVDAALPPDSEWQTGCKFPSVAKNVKYLWVEVYGGGGGGARGYATPWVSKTYTYDLGTPAPRDGEYEVSAYAANRGTSMYWYNDNNSAPKGVYYTLDPDTKDTCPSYKFGDFVEEDTKYNYADCKTYTAEDKCVYTGDSTAIKTSNCISSVEKAGKYCFVYTSQRPPNAYLSESQIVAQCTASGKENCKAEEKAVTYSVPSKKCLNQRSLPSVYYGNSSPGVSGKLYLKEGEYLKLKRINDGEHHESGDLGGYEHSSAQDGNDYGLYHTKTNVSGGVMHVTENLVAKMYGGTAGVFTLSTTNKSRCCTNCGKLEKYLNSSKTTEVVCAKDGDNGTTTLTNAYKDLLKTGSTTKSEISILNQDFDYYHGCSGKNGSYSANLFPTSRNHNYDIKVGKGGTGAKGETGNTVTESAQDGENSYFGWIVGAGGKGASDYCKVKTPEERETNFFNAGIGGKGGTVEFPGGKTPKRDYDLTPEEDIIPNNRWIVQDGSNGTSGIIVVSW